MLSIILFQSIIALNKEKTFLLRFVKLRRPTGGKKADKDKRTVL